MADEHESTTDEQFESIGVEPSNEQILDAAKRAAKRGTRLALMLSILTALTWIAAGAMAVWTTDVCLKIAFNGYHGPMTRYQDFHNELMDEYGDRGMLSGDDVPEELWEEHGKLRRVLSERRLAMETLTTITIALFITAALLSVVLIIASRRSTLAQVTASIRSIELALQSSAGLNQ